MISFPFGSFGFPFGAKERAALGARPKTIKKQFEKSKENRFLYKLLIVE